LLKVKNSSCNHTQSIENSKKIETCFYCLKSSMIHKNIFTLQSNEKKTDVIHLFSTLDCDKMIHRNIY